MAKSEFNFDEIVLEKRTTDADQPATGKFALYNKNGGLYTRDGNTGDVSPMSASALPFAYLGSDSQTSISQWNISISSYSGYDILRFLFKVTSGDTATRSMRMRFNNDAAASQHGYQYTYGTTTAVTATGNTAQTFVQVGTNLVPENDRTPDFSFIWVDVHHHADTDKEAVVIFHGYWPGLAQYSHGGHYKKTDAITQLSFYPHAGTFGDISYKLWGVQTV